MNLWLVGHPKANTIDSSPGHNHGSGRYYPAGRIKPTKNECWSVPPFSIGYDEAVGITFEQIFMLIPDSLQTVLMHRSHDVDYDGFDPTFSNRSDVEILGSFDVVTSP